MLNRLLLTASCAAFLTGCGSSPPAPEASSATASTNAATPAPATASSGSSPVAASPGGATASPAPAPLPRISLGGGGASTSAPGRQSPGGTEEVSSFTRDEVLAALKPMQILRDEWNAVRQKSVGGQDAGEKQVWIWDFRSNPRQPSLVMNSPDSKYFTQARLTYDPPSGEFRLRTTDPEDQERTFEGTFSEPVQEIQLGNDKVHRTYKLQLTELNPTEAKDQWQVVLNQQENDRYLLQLFRKRGEKFQPFETIAAQRNGTSFALSDTDYGDKTCIISGGLGTMQVSYNGKSYWVCCTGCKAAFDEEPARWIAEYEAKSKAAK